MSVRPAESSEQLVARWTREDAEREERGKYLGCPICKQRVRFTCYHDGVDYATIELDLPEPQEPRLTDLTLFREYEPHELGKDGYPLVWHKLPEPEFSEILNEADLVLPSGVKDVVRAFAGHRCERCRHPYRTGTSAIWEKAPGGEIEQLDSTLWENEPSASTPRAAGAVCWSRCDGNCTHGGPVRIGVGSDAWRVYEPDQLVEGWRPAAERREVQAAWRVLTVHHLNGRKHDLRWWNLCALCQRCHLEIQNKVLMEAVFPLEHSEWFKIHAAGWYAYAYGGENLTRQETAERLDELLGLERMA